MKLYIIQNEKILNNLNFSVWNLGWYGTSDIVFMVHLGGNSRWDLVARTHASLLLTSCGYRSPSTIRNYSGALVRKFVLGWKIIILMVSIRESYSYNWLHWEESVWSYLSGTGVLAPELTCSWPIKKLKEIVKHFNKN